jgi:hypothetical protein
MNSQAISWGMMIAIQIGLILLLGSIGLLERSRHAKQLLQMKKQQEAAQSTLHNFMEECEKTFLEFSRIIAMQRASQAELAANSGAFRGLPSEHDAEGALPSGSFNPSLIHAAGGRRVAENRKNQVLHLAQKGMNANEIAGRLDVPRGEIDLILSLKGEAFVKGAPN